MRIDWLRIRSFRNLQEFEIDFNEKETTTVLIGHNSTGKSNLIEAIVKIFSELDSGKATNFHYTIRFMCYENSIEINCDPDRKPKLQISINDKRTSLAEFNRNKHNYLPANIFGYYSGWSNRLEKIFDDKARDYYYALLNNPDDDMPLRRFFFCRKEYSQLVLLAFFLDNEPAAQQFLNEYLDLKIKGFESALFYFHKPWWGRSSNDLNTEDQGSDPRFWQARGAFRPFLNKIWKNALAPIRTEETIVKDFRKKGEKTERLYLFIKNEEQLKALRQQYESTKLFFSNLESLYLCDLLDDVQIKVRKNDGNLITFKQLSEGEQQLLTVIGLLLFTQSEESLYLLDEPNTHLNPVWSYDFISLLKENLDNYNGQMIISTHDPMMVGSLYKTQVRILTQQKSGTVASEPDYDPRGIGIEGLLKSELYGLRSSLPKDILNDIDTQNKLLGLTGRTEAQEKTLQEVSAKLKKLGITRSHPNPLFDLFSKAIANEPIFQKPELTKEDLELQEKIANEILDKLLNESTK